MSSSELREEYRSSIDVFKRPASEARSGKSLGTRLHADELKQFRTKVSLTILKRNILAVVHVSLKSEFESDLFLNFGILIAVA